MTLSSSARSLSAPLNSFRYLKRRQRVDEMRCAIAPDELDYFMHYLLVGLFWEASFRRHRDGPRPASFSHRATRLVFLLQARPEADTRAAPIRQAPRRRARATRLPRREQGSRASGCRARNSRLEREGRTQIVSTMKDLKRRSALDHSVHDATIVSGDYAVTVMTAPSTRSGEVVDSAQVRGPQEAPAQARRVGWLRRVGWAARASPDRYRPNHALAAEPRAGHAGRLAPVGRHDG